MKLEGEFKLGFITLLPAIAIIILLLCKVNAVVSLGLSAICAGAVSFFYQGATLQSIIRVAYNGYSTSIEEGILQTILNRVCGNHLLCSWYGRYAGSPRRSRQSLKRHRKSHQQRWQPDCSKPFSRLCNQLNQLFPADVPRPDWKYDETAVQIQKNRTGNPFPYP